jgi:hypothetical protein
MRNIDETWISRSVCCLPDRCKKVPEQTFDKWGTNQILQWHGDSGVCRQGEKRVHFVKVFKYSKVN